MGSGTTYECQTHMWLGPHDPNEVLEAKLNEESSGITWVFMQGSDCICVMSADKNRSMGHDKDKCALRDFLKNLFEVIANPYTDYNCVHSLNSHDSGATKPFAVVCAVQGVETINTFDLEASIACLGEKKAIDILEEKLRTHPTFTLEESIQTGLLALSYMVVGDLDADNIEVCYRRKGDATTHVLPTIDIKRQLDNISRKSSETVKWTWKRVWKSQEIGDFSSSFWISPCGHPISMFIDYDFAGGADLGDEEIECASDDDISCRPERSSEEMGDAEEENRTGSGLGSTYE